MKVFEIDELYISMSCVVVEMNNLLKVLKTKDGKNDVITNIREIDATISYVIADNTIVKMKYQFTCMIRRAKTVIKWLEENEDKMLVDDIKTNKLINNILSNSICKHIVEKCRFELI